MNKKVGIFLIALGILVVSGILYYLFFLDSGLNPLAPEKEQERGELQTGSLKDQGKAGSGAEVKTAASPKIEISGDGIKKSGLEEAASSFAERFGSYSNQSGFENLKDLEAQMTESFKNYAVKLKSDLEKQFGNYKNYYSINSKALNATAENFDANSAQAKVVVLLLREEVRENGPSREFFQDLALNMVRDGNSWKVDRAEWSAERKK